MTGPSRRVARWPAAAPCRARSASAAARGASTTSLARASCCSRGARPICRPPHVVLPGRLAAHGVALDQLDDLDGRVTAWFDEHRLKAVLVRPDGYVFGAVEALEDARGCRVMSTETAPLADAQRLMRSVSWAHMAISTRFRAPSLAIRLAR